MRVGRGECRRDKALRSSMCNVVRADTAKEEHFSLDKLNDCYVQS